MLFKLFAIIIPFSMIMNAQEVTLINLNSKDATPGYLQHLEDLFMDSFHAIYIKDWDAKIEQEQKDVFISNMREFQTNSNMILFIAKKDNQVARFSLFKKVDDENTILEIICINPAFWRQGIGKKLAFGIDWLNERWQAGKPPTYQEFANMWQQEVDTRKDNKPQPKQEWALITFVQKYVKVHPNASKIEVTQAWHKKREQMVAVVNKYYRK